MLPPLATLPCAPSVPAIACLWPALRCATHLCQLRELLARETATPVSQRLAQQQQDGNEMLGLARWCRSRCVSYVLRARPSKPAKMVRVHRCAETVGNDR